MAAESIDFLDRKHHSESRQARYGARQGWGWGFRWFQEAPRRRSVLHNQKTVTLDFPWVVFCEVSRHPGEILLFVWLSPNKIISEDDLLYICPLAHINMFGFVCFSSLVNHDIRSGRARSFDMFWLTDFGGPFDATLVNGTRFLMVGGEGDGQTEPAGLHGWEPYRYLDGSKFNLTPNICHLGSYVTPRIFMSYPGECGVSGY